ncbi:MAG: nucleotide sugar dehydrogenase [Geminicoccaceae bacterium]|nr:nucleotide sugar dehydrogenase [Geminicoccaceae bacterium]
MLRTAILGLGYVGTTTAACLLEDGHRVLGVDINPAKVEALGRGRSPVVEPGVEERLQAGVEAGRMTAATDIAPHIDDLDLVIVCVGTPSRADGKLDLTHLLEVTRQLGRSLAGRSADRPPLLLVFRSTMPPGTMDRLVAPTLRKAAGEAPGGRYEIAFNPEFLRESTAVKDYFSPPKIVIGEREPGLTKKLMGIYDGIEAPIFEVPFGTAEMAKMVDNSFHALKVAFANEIGRIALSKNIDPQSVADLFLADTKLNISPYYLRPGGPFGGSCLPKDLSAMLALARESGLSVPVLSGARESNAMHLAWILQAIKRRAPAPGPVLLLGLSFKSGTDDLRNSPLLALAEMLLEAGYDLSVHDPDLDSARLVGVNFALGVEHQEVLVERMVEDVEPAAAKAAVMILGKPMKHLPRALLEDPRLIDIDRLGTSLASA